MKMFNFISKIFKKKKEPFTISHDEFMKLMLKRLEERMKLTNIANKKYEREFGKSEEISIRTPTKIKKAEEQLRPSSEQ